MKAIVRNKAGKNLSTMSVQDLPKAPLGDREVRVRMHRSRINPVDVDLMKGMPFLKYKKPQIGGIDGSGVIVEIGAKIADFQPGDEVFFYRLFTDIGTWAEEVNLPADNLAKIPTGVNVNQAGAIALPLLTAYESLRSLKASAGERILIHGAGGGVGFPAVQIARKMGLRVWATGSERDREALEHAGVERMIDYKTEAFEEVLAPGKIDYVFDVIGKEVLLKSLALKPKKIVSVAYADTDKLAKTGLKMPGLLKGLMKMMMGKFRKAARKNGVELIGQVTGANGKLLQEASDFVSDIDFRVRPSRELAFSEIARKGFPEQPIGYVIDFTR